MPNKALVLTAAIFAGTICTAHAAGSAETQFVKTEISCISGTSCAVRVQLPANRLISLKGISCVDLSENVTSVDIKIAKDGLTFFESALLMRDVNKYGNWDGVYVWKHQNLVIATKSKELWINLKTTTAGQMAATCYAAF